MYGTEKYVRDAEKPRHFDAGDAYDKAKRFDAIMALALEANRRAREHYLAEMLDGPGANAMIDEATRKKLAAEFALREAIAVELLRRETTR